MLKCRFLLFLIFLNTEQDTNSKEYKELAFKQQTIRKEVDAIVQPVRALLLTLLDLTRYQRDVSRRWIPCLLPIIYDAVAYGSSLVEIEAREVLVSLCACCPSPVHRVATQLARTYEVVMSGQSLSNHGDLLRDIVEAVYAGTCGE